MGSLFVPSGKTSGGTAQTHALSSASSCVALVGDFNTPISVMSNRVGARVGLCPTARPVDAAELCDLVADCDVLHVNSWTRYAKPTFRHGSNSSLIDHVFIRHSLGDSICGERVQSPGYSSSGARVVITCSSVLVYADSMSALLLSPMVLDLACWIASPLSKSVAIPRTLVPMRSMCV